MSNSVLVIGGGIAGIQASLDLAEAGARVVLVEREATIGGVMAVLDKNFPTLDCSICIEAPKMSEVDLHPNIEIISLAEVTALEGEPGDFRVTIRQQARYVTDECTRCGKCTEVCPVVLPNEYDSGMAARKAIYTPIPQSAPGAYLIDMEHCLNEPPNYLPCDRCVQACEAQAIDFLMPQEETLIREVGSVVVAVGYDMLDPRKLKEYGYGTHPDILTSLEFERLLNSAGPTGGEIVRLSDGAHPRNILFVLCVGSRDRRFQHYCSRFCCMYSIKHAYQVLDHGVDDVTVLYMDIRAYGKGFDGFWERTADAGAKFVRGRPARIEAKKRESEKARERESEKASGREGEEARKREGENTQHVTRSTLEVTYENTDTATRITEEFDMVVLANAVTPPEGLRDLAGRLGIELDGDGFLRATEMQGGLITTTRPGIYAAGCDTGPKDIPDSVAEGSGAAALAVSHLTARYWPELPDVEPMPNVEMPRVGVFVCHCGSNIAGVVDVERVAAYAQMLPDVVYTSHQLFSCAGNTQHEIEEALKEHQITRVVIAACSPKTHESIFRGVLIRSGLNPYLLEMANIRNMDSWVHKFEKEKATIKAMDMVSMAVEKARRLVPLESSHLPLIQSALVIGGGIAGMTAATALARQGYETHLVEQGDRWGGLLTQLEHIAPANLEAADIVATKARDLAQSGVRLHLNTQVETIGGVVGNFHTHLSDGDYLDVGAIVMATGATPYQPEEFNYAADPRVITNLELEGILSQKSKVEGQMSKVSHELVTAAERITFISCVGSRQGRIGCSRYCCTSMISQALQLWRMGKQVRVVSKDIRTYSRQAEELYEEAMRAGVQFFRYDDDRPPQEVLTVQDGNVELYDHLLGAEVRIPTDLLVLVVGLRPPEDNLADQLKLSKSEDGFYMELHPKLGPVETAVQGVYLAGASQGAKDVRESMAQALAAAGKAGALLARGEIEKEPLTAKHDPEKCIGCMRCVKVCPFNAIEQIGELGKGTVRITEAACMGCGNCAAECPVHAIEMPYFTGAQVLAQVDAALAENPEQKCIVFTCNWCSYAGADLAGIEKRQYPTSARIIRTMCSARLEERFVARAFEQGAGAVLVTGCRLTENGSDCHYNYANTSTAKRFKRWQRKFTRKGVAPERLQLRWISAAEGKEFAEKITEMDEIVREYAAGEEEE
ncbi:MAG TPA: hydrogenase iron-sulfur subunit [Thermoflexia bacterium]|nr:hydrogenase iron-sulfur subunit [Thermoflexia bacterium]